MQIREVWPGRIRGGKVSRVGDGYLCGGALSFSNHSNCYGKIFGINNSCDWRRTKLHHIITITDLPSPWPYLAKPCASVLYNTHKKTPIPIANKINWCLSFSLIFHNFTVSWWWPQSWWQWQRTVRVETWRLKTGEWTIDRVCTMIGGHSSPPTMVQGIIDNAGNLWMQQ